MRRAAVAVAGKCSQAILRDGVAHGVVGGSLGELAAVQVGDRDAGEQGRAGGGQGLVAVAQQDEQVGPLGVERRGDAVERGGHGARDAELRVVVERQRHARGDAMAVALDLVRRSSPKRGERCVPVTISDVAKPGSAASSSSRGWNSPYSARVPVRTAILCGGLTAAAPSMGSSGRVAARGDETHDVVPAQRRQAGAGALDREVVGRERLAGGDRPRGDDALARRRGVVELGGGRPLDAVAQGDLDGAQGEHHLGERAGFERGAVVGPRQAAVEREVLLDDARRRGPRRPPPP